MCNGGISIASLSAGASLSAAVLALALESSSALLSRANPSLFAGEDLESPTPDIMDSTRVPFSARLFLRCLHMKKITALTAKAATIAPTPITIPIIVPDGIPLSVFELGFSFWATVLLEEDEGVGVSPLLPDAAVLCAVDGVAVAVDGAE